MELDSERLISLVQERPALFNFKMKEHSNKDFVQYMWEEIALAMNASVNDCRLKWHNLRCSYARCLRDAKKWPDGSGASKRKKWYLADSMSFLEGYISQNKKIQSNINCSVEGEAAIEEDISDSSMNSESTSFSTSIKLSSNKRKPSAAKAILAVPINNFLESISESQLKEADTPLLHFCKALIPDVEKLCSKRQRIFKEEFLKLVNKLVSEEEDQILSRS